MTRLILASNSPRRRELLAQLDVAFEVVVRPVDESCFQDLEPGARVEKLAGVKALAVAAELAGGLVLGADTLVAVSGRVMGKPDGAAGARLMLRMLAGRWHRVYTGVALVDASNGRLETAVASTAVFLKAMSEGEIGRYVATGEPLDKAGAYAVQGLGAIFVTAIEGSYSNVVGLPLHLVADMLHRFGLEVI
ncbi:MAG TPA: Maf family protein [Spirochaetia bacterium]|nr:Maf family protein [Spirochaetia bacterium]